MSTHAVIHASQALPSCINLVAGKELCLPEPCTVYRVQFDETCDDIVAAVPGLKLHNLLAWNPNINPLCRNIRSMYEDLICVSPPGRSLEDVTSVTPGPPPSTTQPPPTAVPRPSNAKAESHELCAGWYEVQAGDHCQLISIRAGIEIRDFFFLNPSVDDPGCTDLWLDTSYCVKPVGDINTYPSYPHSTAPPYTLTPPDYVTTTRPPLETVAPSATPIVVLPLAPGSLNKADGCLDFAQHKVIPVPKDQSQQPDVPSLTSGVNMCDYLSAIYDVSPDELVEWNPTLAQVDPCQLQPGFRYCVDHVNATREI